MCGIFAHIGKINDDNHKDMILSSLNKISYRGPDSTEYQILSDDVMLGFHRLSIMDETESGNQPMTHPDDSNIIMVCNGEIYNHEDLKDKFSIKTRSNSDCEVILHLYKIMPIKELLSNLDGVFAFVIYDKNKDIIYAARDRIGVRPMFMGTNGSKSRVISSEAKSIVEICSKTKHFPPGTFWSSDKPSKFSRYYKYSYKKNNSFDEKEICKNINELLTNAVRKRLMSDREIGCLLSGGLDSSLIASLVQRDISSHSKTSSGTGMSRIPKRVKTFSIGMEGSPDLEYAKKVALWIGSDHHEVLLTAEDFLNSIREVIYKIESYDTTTVRASIGNYLVSKYISENTDCKVIFNGDGSDEVCAGYVYNKNAPSFLDLQKESVRLVKELHYFDVLRSDRSISSNGLEPRTPFLDIDFVNYYMSIRPELKTFDKKKVIEKRLLRKAFSNQNLLPESVLWRDKCAFSDGVSSSKNSWHKVLQNHIDSIISDDDFKLESSKIKHCKPLLKESLYYRKIYIELFGDNENLVPHFWMPRWSNVIDPSARELDGYKE